MGLLGKTFFWVAILIIMILGAVILLFGVDWNGATYFGFPSWMLFFFSYTLFFSLMMGLFCKYYWR